MIREVSRRAAHGLAVLPILLVLLLVLPVVAIAIPIASRGLAIVIIPVVLLWLAAFVGLFGLFIVNPNEARVLQLFGEYRGTVHDDGLRWANPFYTKRSISLRVRNFESAQLKVNDFDGNPIDIASIVVWRVVDSAQALFAVDDVENFVRVQSESALRAMASQHPYDAHTDTDVALRRNAVEIAALLQREIQDRLAMAGVEVLEARISHLAYAQEIASAMLQRQQAGAIVAARQKIVEGAVGMVEMALEMLSRSNVVTLDEDRKAAMVANLLVVLCAHRDAQPVVQAGSRER